MKYFLSIFILIILVSCRTMGSFSGSLMPTVSSGSHGQHKDIPKLTKEQIEMMRARDVKKEEERQVVNKDQLTHFGVMVGRYVARRGILKKLGDVGISLGLNLTQIYQRKKEPKLFDYNLKGFYLMWTFDHFWRTNSKLLKPKFIDDNYTNYMLIGGWHTRFYFSKYFFFSYSPGLAINFIEIDSFGTEGEDQEHSDITFSLAHRISFCINMGKGDVDGKKDYLSFTLFQYYSPDPVGKFLNSNDEDHYYDGGSIAFYLEYNWLL